MLVSKVGDVVAGMCVCVPYPPGPFPATGVVINGSPTIMTTAMPITIAGLSMVMFPCGTSIITPLSVSLMSAGMSAGKTGDIVSGCGNGTLVGTSTITSL